MFETHPEFEITTGPAPELFGLDPGVKRWHAFDVMFNDYWFIGEILLGEDVEGYFQRWNTICASDISSLIELVAQDYVIEHRLNLVIPPSYTVNHQFAIKPLIEIIFADEEGQPSMTIFVTSDNSRYVKSALGLTEADATNTELIYAREEIASRE